MTFFELTDALNKMNQEDPFVTRTGINGSVKAESAMDETYVHVSFSGNYTGGVRNIKVNSRGTVAMLDGSFDPSDNVDVGVEALWLSCNNAIMSGVGYAELGYYIPSAGYFPVVEVNHKRGDWGDGDGPYDYVDFICTEEPLDIGEVVMSRWESLVPQNLRESKKKVNEGLEDDDPINEDVGTVEVTFNYGDGDEDYDTGYIVQYADRYEVQSDLNMATGKTIEEMKANFEKEVRDNLDYDVEDVSFDWDIEEALTEDVGEWHGMSREDIQDFAENSSEYWTGDDSWVEGIVQWLLDCDDEDVWDIVTSDNIDEDDDTFLMNEFMASDYCDE